MDYKNVIERAVWTFIQAFTAAFAFADISTARDATVAGGAAVLSVLKNLAAERLAALDR